MKVVREDVARLAPSRLDRVIEYAAPQWGLRRRAARFRLLAGEKMRRALDERFSASSARRTERFGEGWGSHPIFGRAQLPDRQSSVRRTHELYQRNPTARGAIDRLIDNMIGRGIRPQALTADKDWNRRAEELAAAWAEDGCDVERRTGGLYGVIQPLLAASVAVSGDALLVLLKSGEVQLIDGTQIECPPGEAGNPYNFDGVELNPQRRPLAYHVREDGAALSWARIDPRYGIFLGWRLFATDVRGWPALSCGDGLYDQVDASVEAVTAAAQMAANFGLLITGDTGLLTGDTLSDAQGRQRPVFDLEPAMVKVLAPGQDVRQVTPQHPSQNYPDFLRALSRYLGLPTGTPLEILMLDFSQSNYSSARAAILQYKKAVQRKQVQIISALRRLWSWRVAKWMDAGELERRPDAFRHIWIPPGWELLDLQKEMAAYSLALDRGFMSRRSICASIGDDSEVIVAQLAQEQQEMDALGLARVYSTMTREPGAPGNGRAAEEEEKP